jgi:ubiquinone/menaquinone biosynthesis C-methylase UbiE
MIIKSSSFTTKADNTQQESISTQKLVDRVAQLGKVHDVNQSQLSSFADATGLHSMVGGPEIQLVDLFCGTGFLASALVNKLMALAIPVTIHLIDICGQMLQNAKSSITEQVPQSHRNRFAAMTYEQELNSGKLPFANEQLDLAVVKMGLHELPFKSQISLVQETFYVLKPGGRFVIWGNLIDKDQLIGQDLNWFNSIIRTKDLLAGFDRMSAKRYFTSQEEMFSALTGAGFTVQLVVDWIRRWNSLTRLNFELDGDVGKLNELNTEIDKHFTDETRRKEFEFCSTVNEVGITGRAFNVRSGIILAQKPLE